MNAPETPPYSAVAVRSTPRHRWWTRLAIPITGVLFLYAGPVSAQAVDATTAVHFLEQATFGPTALDVASVQSIGPSAWIQQQFQMPESQMPAGLDSNAVRAQLYLNMANGPDQLRQRAIFALSQTIVVSANKVNTGESLIPWVRLLSRNAFGNYRTLLREVSLSPTMGKYLDNVFNRKATATTAANENYARELLQLFSIGVWELNTDGSLKLDGGGNPIPTYSQATIGEFAKALTGWTYPPMPGATSGNSNPEYFVGELVPTSNAGRHDTVTKTLLNGYVVPANLTAAQELDHVIDNIFYHSNVPPFVATRLIRSLVTSNPSPAYVQRISNVFINNGSGVRGDLAAVFAAILLDPEALSPAAAEHGRLKDPVLHVMGMGRALNAQLGDPASFQFVFSNLSQRVLTPATVFSFYSPTAKIPSNSALFGPEFQLYPPALAIQRANFIYGILTGQYGSAFSIDMTPFRVLAGDAAALVEKVSTALMMGRMSPALRQIILTATNAVPASDPNQRALGAVYLAAISSEYSVYSSGFTAGGVIPTTVQAPTGLYVAAVNGNTALLRWNPPLLGPPPETYVLEGGIRPGEVLASISTGSAAPSFIINAPTGQFFVRMRSMAQGSLSLPSNEVPLNPNARLKPSAPTNVQGAIKGNALFLAWRNTYTGGTPTNIVMDVTGPATVSVPLGLTDAFNLGAAPNGTWTFRFRAENAVGSSSQSSSVTLTAPSTSCALPRVPLNFVASAGGGGVHLSWDSPSGGTPAASYILNVQSAVYTGGFPLAARAFSSPAPRGTYTFSVQAVNACGAGPVTAFQTVTVQ
jgi:uncharacterized protein (DUF1800 family)